TLTSTYTMQPTATYTATAVNTATRTSTVTMTYTATRTITPSPTTVPGGSIIASIVAPSVGVVGGQITVVMNVFNNGTIAIDDISASVLVVSNPSALSIVSGPAGNIATLAPGTGDSFTWVYNVDTEAANVTLSGLASGFNSITSAVVATSLTASNDIQCQNPTFTVTATGTFTRTVTNTPTYTSTVTSTFTRTASPTAQNTATFTRTVTLTPTITPSVQEVKDLVPFPNPAQPQNRTDMTVSFNVNQKDCDAIGMKIYSSSLRLIKVIEPDSSQVQGMIDSGRFIYSARELDGLANGTYYYVLYVKQGTKETRSRVDKIVILK
ncbi:MAG TPA: hypothetical protein P5511_01195, partial [Candidatus Goldiibacteriota bacterium]|nr:hypothetical protein [Candidatus Goldiibacteriota bacterium]